MSDLISRQEAIDAIDECFKKVVRARNMSAYAYDSAYTQGEIDAYVTAIDTLKALAPAQPEQVCVATVTLTDEQVKEAVEKAKNGVISVIEPEPHWIPCSERLPKKTGYYLTSNEYKVVHEDYYWGNGCFEKAKKYQCEVVAWMPMPIPPYYGGNGE